MPTRTGISQDELRSVNLSAVLTRVHAHGADHPGRADARSSASTAARSATSRRCSRRSAWSASGGRPEPCGAGPAVAPRRARVRTSPSSPSTSTSTGSSSPWSGSAARCWSAASAGTSVASHDVEHVVGVGGADASRSCSRCPARPLPRASGVSVPGVVRRRRRAGALRAQPGLGRRAVHRAARSGPRPAGRAPATTPTSVCSPSTCAAPRSASRRRLPQRQRRHRWRLPGRRAAAARCRRVRRRGRPPARGQPGPACRCGARVAGRRRSARTTCSRRPAGSPVVDRRRSPR